MSKLVDPRGIWERVNRSIDNVDEEVIHKEEEGGEASLGELDSHTAHQEAGSAI